MDTDSNRRIFLRQSAASLGMFFLASLTPEIVTQAQAYAASSTANAEKPFRIFTPQQAADFDAFSAQIIPTDDRPGAREANVVRFTDYVLSVFDTDQQDAMKTAFKVLQENTAKQVPGASSFAAVTPAQQIAIMKAMEKTPEFGILRAYTIIGFLCDPDLGGNKDKVGWKLIGFEDSFLYKPPFGYYDAHAGEKA